jgi:hypothetical protein
MLRDYDTNLIWCNLLCFVMSGLYVHVRMHSARLLRANVADRIAHKQKTRLCENVMLGKWFVPLVGSFRRSRNSTEPQNYIIRATLRQTHAREKGP